MICYTNKHKIPFEIDDEDLELVMKFAPWHIKNGYVEHVIPQPKKTSLPLQNLIMNFNSTPKKFVDHRDHIKTNCKKNNLRIVNNSQNQSNRRPNFKKSLQYKGVSLKTTTIPSGRKYQYYYSTIGLNEKTYHLGTFKEPIEAAITYDIKSLELFGDFACLNLPEYLLTYQATLNNRISPKP